MVLAAQLERLVAGDRKAGLIEAALAGIDDAGEDQRLRLATAVGEAAFDQGDVESRLRRRPGPAHRTCASSSARVRRWKRQVRRDAEAARPSARPHHTPTAP